jgi:hypothetical protein
MVKKEIIFPLENSIIYILLIVKYLRNFLIRILIYYLNFIN